MPQIDEHQRPFPKISINIPSDSDLANLLAGSIPITRKQGVWINVRDGLPHQFYDGETVKVISSEGTWRLYRVRLLMIRGGVSIDLSPLPP